MTRPIATTVCTIGGQDVADTITLDETARHRRRIALVSDNGIDFVLDLPEARLIRHGEGLKLSDGRIVEVRAKPEKLYRVRARSPHHLLQLAWHLGNRHCPSQISADSITIRQDHTLRTMLEGLGAAIEEELAPFDPQGGAYEDNHLEQDHHHDKQATHNHGHSHD